MKNKKIIAAIITLGILTSCTQEPITTIADENVTLTAQTSQKLLSISQINETIDNSMRKTGSFDWENTTSQTLWSAAIHGGGYITIGYGNKGESFRTAPVKRLTDTKNNIITTIQQIEGAERNAFIIEDDPVLNAIDVKIESIEAIQKLRSLNNIRYIEPNGYSFFTNAAYPQNRSSSGCGMDGNTLNNQDFRTISPGSLVSWTFDEHNITQAWEQSTGAGVTVAVIDTGVSPNQSLLGTNINDGQSNGRTIQKYGTYIDSPWWWSNNLDGPNDRCGHGTSMIAALGAPRNNNNLPVGVAYNSNIISYRATADVLLNDYHERKGVKNALVALGNRNDVKIISMSIGYPWGIGNVRDGVKYAHSKGKLIFAAGGTSLNFTNWYPVIFPANMDEAVAVTGITDNGNYQQCDTCHDGNEIEFTIVMERENNNSRTAAVLGFYNGDTNYVGGSSVATATTAGIAALVWSKYPNWSREQVLNRMRQSSDLYPNKSSTKGYGNIDALQAVQ